MKAFGLIPWCSHKTTGKVSCGWEREREREKGWVGAYTTACFPIKLILSDRHDLSSFFSLYCSIDENLMFLTLLLVHVYSETWLKRLPVGQNDLYNYNDHLFMCGYWAVCEPWSTTRWGGSLFCTICMADRSTCRDWRPCFLDCALLNNPLCSY